VTGEYAALVFRDEAGGHRFQRVPPNEKRGRVHTSTITVATLPEPSEVQFVLRPQDVEITTCRSSGAGGQHVNKVESAVQAKHLPTGLMVRCETERSQQQNRLSALALLRARLWEAERKKADDARASDRKKMLGSGMGGFKRRTIAIHRDQVVDHVLGVKTSYSVYVKGIFDGVW